MVKQYFVEGWRHDDSWDNCGETIDEVFDTKEQAEAYILELLTRPIGGYKDRWKPEQITVIYGEIVKFTTNEITIAKVSIS
jgi:hypothetical protein